MNTQFYTLSTLRIILKRLICFVRMTFKLNLCCTANMFVQFFVSKLGQRVIESWIKKFCAFENRIQFSYRLKEQNYHQSPQKFLYKRPTQSIWANYTIPEAFYVHYNYLYHKQYELNCEKKQNICNSQAISFMKSIRKYNFQNYIILFNQNPRCFVMISLFVCLRKETISWSYAQTHAEICQIIIIVYV